MTEDPTRAMPRQPDPRSPTHGRVGPADPNADPVTHPGLPPVPALPAGESPTVPTPGLPVGGGAAPASAASRSRTGMLWSGVIASAVVLLFLLIFILQNGAPVQINFLWLSGTLPSGVALLFAAIAGVVLVAIPGVLRITQLRRAARRGARTPR